MGNQSKNGALAGPGRLVLVPEPDGAWIGHFEGAADLGGACLIRGDGKAVYLSVRGSTLRLTHADATNLALTVLGLTLDDEGYSEADGQYRNCLKCSGISFIARHKAGECCPRQETDNP